MPPAAADADLSRTWGRWSEGPEGTIRLATIEDASAVQAIYAPIVLHTTTSFEEVPPTVAEMARRIAATVAVRPWLVCEIGGAVAGYAYAGAHRERAAYRWSVEPSVYVHEAYRRRGVGQALYTALFAALEAQGYRNLYAGVTLPNDASLALHRALGFADVGVYDDIGYKQGAWRSVWWGQKRLGGDAPPSEPLGMARLTALPAWKAALQAGAARLSLPSRTSDRSL